MLRKLFLLVFITALISVINLPFITCSKCNGSGRAISQLLLGCSRCMNDGKLSVVDLVLAELKLNKPPKINEVIDESNKKIKDLSK